MLSATEFIWTSSQLVEYAATYSNVRWTRSYPSLDDLPAWRTVFHCIVSWWFLLYTRDKHRTRSINVSWGGHGGARFRLYPCTQFLVGGGRGGGWSPGLMLRIRVFRCPVLVFCVDLSILFFIFLYCSYYRWDVGVGGSSRLFPAGYCPPTPHIGHCVQPGLRLRIHKKVIKTHLLSWFYGGFYLT